ncbi:hypothetical protein RhiirA5_419784 [Rhizophagus irregularis]|uniref:F-box domain-containing protein n=1 Tax=Rhizophagus irregularis TaxID=588596 RepID=A0A2N0PHJ0_9GLOM|nr:hypothetical protein RhiirA5_419784 [Rhizophagus irregularis]
MTILNRDVLYLIFKDFQNDKKSLFSCLSVNKTWSEIIISILWINPWKYLKRGNEKLLSNVIISHISNKSNKKPLFNYISLCRHLNLNEIERIFNNHNHFEEIKNDILNLFINENTKYTHLYISQRFDYQINLIPKSKHCFSEIEFLSCDASINDNILNGLSEMCKSIKELELFIQMDNYNYGITKLIENQNKLFKIHFIIKYSINDDSFWKVFENSLIKHSNTIKYFKLTEKFMERSFQRICILELGGNFRNMKLDHSRENLSLPFLRILKANDVPVNFLTNLIESSNGYLVEINICYINNLLIQKFDNNKIIQTIYKNCSNLKYLRLLCKSSNILELKNLLINCQYLDGLYVDTNFGSMNWKDLFIILTESSPISLFKFKFHFSYELPNLEYFKLFFDNWKGRNPMLLQFLKTGRMIKEYNDLIEKYKSEGIIKKFDYEEYSGDYFDEFEWIKTKKN